MQETRYYTDVQVEDITLLAAVDSFAAELHADLYAQPSLPKDTEVVLHLYKDGEDMIKQYYLASSEHSSVFWLEPMDPDWVTTGARPLRDLTYISQSRCFSLRVKTDASLSRVCNSCSVLVRYMDGG